MWTVLYHIYMSFLRHTIAKFSVPQQLELALELRTSGCAPIDLKLNQLIESTASTYSIRNDLVPCRRGACFCNSCNTTVAFHF